MQRSLCADATAAPSNTPDAFTDGLPLPALYAELVFAVARSIDTRVTFNGIARQYRCADCNRWDDSQFTLTHTQDCPTGKLARLMAAIGAAEAKAVSPTPQKRSLQPQPANCCEPSGAAVAGQPQLMPDGLRSGVFAEPWQVNEKTEVVDADGHTVWMAQGCDYSDERAAKIARRMVDCVNACADMTVPAGGFRAARWVGGAQ